jgi:hypothetical protein
LDTGSGINIVFPEHERFYVPTAGELTVRFEDFSDGYATKHTPRRGLVDAEPEIVNGAIVAIAVASQVFARMTILRTATLAASLALVFRKPFRLVADFGRHIAPFQDMEAQRRRPCSTVLLGRVVGLDHLALSGLAGLHAILSRLEVLLPGL